MSVFVRASSRAKAYYRKGRRATFKVGQTVSHSQHGAVKITKITPSWYHWRGKGLSGSNQKSDITLTRRLARKLKST